MIKQKRNNEPHVLPQAYTSYLVNLSKASNYMEVSGHLYAAPELHPGKVSPASTVVGSQYTRGPTEHSGTQFRISCFLLYSSFI
jgi:hypothetical protein